MCHQSKKVCNQKCLRNQIYVYISDKTPFFHSLDNLAYQINLSSDLSSHKAFRRLLQEHQHLLRKGHCYTAQRTPMCFGGLAYTVA